MIIFTDTADVPADFGPTVVAIGKFDGVHAGHQRVLAEAIASAAAQDAKSVALTFDRNPLATVKPEVCPTDLVSLTQKLELLEATGVDAALVLHFDAELAAVPAEDFVRTVLVEALGARTVLIGRDFRFGRGGAGDGVLLTELGERFGFDVVIVGDVGGTGERRVSSSWVRELLAAGEVRRAAELLGRRHAVTGEVVHGLKRGRELGFPTANLSPLAHGIVPADGVYAGWLIADDGVRRPAAISVGTNPTFDDVLVRQVEAYVLDQDDLDLYGQRVTVQFVERIRGMVAFHGIPALIEQMTDDVVRARALLAAEG